MFLGSMFLKLIETYEAFGQIDCFKSNAIHSRSL